MFSSISFADDPLTHCEDIGMYLIAKYEWFDNQGYVFEKPEVYKDYITDLIVITGDANSASWTSYALVNAVIIKGGKPPLGFYIDYSVTYDGETGLYSGSFDKMKILLENHPDISNIEFCAIEPFEPQEPEPIPEFSTYGIIIATIIIAGVATGYIYKKRKQ